MTRLPPEFTERMLAAAREVRSRAYARYSGFHVGAAVFAAGEVYAGVNVENAAYPTGWCAERSAIAAAVTAGHTEIDAIAVVADAQAPTPPCGQCRQALNEFGPDMLVVCEGAGGERASWILSTLLPNAFGPTNLAG
jgi:cytidine deaminase